MEIIILSEVNAEYRGSGPAKYQGYSSGVQLAAFWVSVCLVICGALSSFSSPSTYVGGPLQLIPYFSCSYSLALLRTLKDAAVAQTFNYFPDNPWLISTSAFSFCCL